MKLTQKQKKKKAPAPTPQDMETTGKVYDSMDTLLDEIDEVLEVNAEEFVRGYVQRGGE